MSEKREGLIVGKSAIVTGAGGGIGAAIARAFAEQGATVALVDRDGERAEAARGELAGDGHIARALDVADADAVKETMAEIGAAFDGRIDALVNCAGIREINGPFEITDDEWTRVLGVNLSGSFYCAREVARELMGQGGSIINIASIAGVTGFLRRPAYVSSKSGIVGLSRSLANDLGARGIRVNTICPGLVRSPMTEGYFADADFVESLKPAVPMGRAAEVGEIAGVALFLISDLASYVTGATIPVDGGATVRTTFDGGGGSAAFNDAGNATL
jgi:meso-butanediol dehydrogenase/(S,S)-butanediol dehydrogenase/diacetyl reductase